MCREKKQSRTILTGWQEFRIIHDIIAHRHSHRSINTKFTISLLLLHIFLILKQTSFTYYLSSFTGNRKNYIVPHFSRALLQFEFIAEQNRPQTSHGLMFAKKNLGALLLTLNHWTERSSLFLYHRHFPIDDHYNVLMPQWKFCLTIFYTFLQHMTDPLRHLLCEIRENLIHPFPTNCFNA